MLEIFKVSMNCQLILHTCKFHLFGTSTFREQGPLKMKESLYQIGLNGNTTKAGKCLRLYIYILHQR